MIIVLPLLGGEMATIIKKIKKGLPYYYAVQSARVEGKPRIIWQKYLGTLDTIVRRSDGPSQAVKEVDIFEAGAVAAMLKLASKLQIAETIDEIVPRDTKGPSVGQFILLAAINRVVAPCSKLQMSKWYEETILRRIWKYDSKIFTSQNFWKAMDLFTEEDIEKIQQKISNRVMESFNINPSAILYDTTNFFTYIASGNKRNTLAQRGRSKAKRSDLRQVGLALLCTKEYNIPLFHKIYPGNLADRGLFPEVAKELSDWHKQSSCTSRDTTLAFDKGNISQEAMERLLGTNQHFVCGIPKNVFSELFETNIEQFKSVQNIPGTKAYTCDLEIWNKNFKAVLSYSESFFSAGLIDLTERLQKANKQLHDLDISLSKWGDKPKNQSYPSRKTVQSNINKILSNAYMKRLIEVTILKRDGVCRIDYKIRQNDLDYLIKHELGRTLLISTRRNWSKEKIISTYRGLNAIENAFKNMKHQQFLHWQPTFHWTDQKIGVDALYCVLALLLATLSHKIVQEEGINVSIPVMLEELTKIREVALFYSGKMVKKKKCAFAISKMSARQKKIAQALEIGGILEGNTRF